MSGLFSTPFPWLLSTCSHLCRGAEGDLRRYRYELLKQFGGYEIGAEEAAAEAWRQSRFREYCSILDKAQIRYSIVSKHAFLHRNTYTLHAFVDDLMLVVDSPIHAAEYFVASGLVRETYRELSPESWKAPPPNQSSLSEVERYQYECAVCNPSVALLDAAEWNFGNTQALDKYPSLSQLLNGYLSKYVDLHDSTSLDSYVTIILIGCYDNESNPHIRNSATAIASRLLEENRPLHFAMLSTARSADTAYYREIRDRLRRQRLQPGNSSQKQRIEQAE